MKKVFPTLFIPLLGFAQAQEPNPELFLRRDLAQKSYDCNATTDATTTWEQTLQTCNLQSQHLSFTACTKINTGQRHNDYQSSAHSYAYYVKQFFTFKTCYHGNDWKKLYFWEQGGDEMCKMQTEHTLSIKDYFHATADCVNGFCSACYKQCEGGRRLGDEEEDMNANDNDGGAYDWSQISMKCNVCETGCSSYATLVANYGGNDNNNVQSPYCTRVFDQTGTDYYYGPRCSDSGGVSMGFFFDNQCELNVKKDISVDESANSALSSSFDLFSFVHGICHDCATGVCESVYDAAYHCSNDNGTYVAEGSYIVQEYEGGYGNDEAMESGEELCSKTHKLKDIVYYHNHSSRIKTEKRIAETVGFVLLGLLVAGFAAFGFISYTYYVRHCVDWGDSNLMCWTEGCGGCGGKDYDEDEDDVVSRKKRKGRRLV